ncbi:YdaS family helix-turn-helix protein [Stenotrophomonas acidaminiphila]|jgi:DNA-binding transcriptional regulator YdaS (Cro superfamily)
MSAITAAIDVLQARQADLARKLGVSPQAVNQWVKGRRPVPVRLALVIERETGISRHALRPDVFGAEEGITKRALMQRLALTNDTGLAVLLQLPRETVEEWADDAIVPASPRLHALLADAPAAAVLQEPEDPDAARIVPVETA